MSEPVKNADIEDVLSSIRRLVSEDQRKLSRPVEPAPKPVERLVLTAALRVPEPTPEEPVDAAPDHSFVDTAPAAAAETPQSVEQDVGDLSEVPGDHIHDDGAETAEELHASAPSDDEQTALDDTAQPVEAADIQDLSDEHAAALAAMSADDASAVDDQSDTAEQHDEPLEQAASDAPWQDPDTTLYEAAAAAENSDVGAAAPEDDMRPLGDKIAALEEVIARSDDQWEPDDPGTDEYAGTDVETLEWEDTAPEPDSASRFENASDEEESLDDLDPSPEDALLDEDALRELVADIVREELQGALGERITRNVRKLVRREIHRALTVQDLE